MVAVTQKVRASERLTFPSCGGPVAKCQHVARCDWPRQRLSLLTRTIEKEIVPRLVLARNAVPDVPDAVPLNSQPDPSEAEELARLVVSVDPAEADALVDTIQSRGTPVDALLLDVLAPAARRLGELWTEDLCDFAQVTMGLWRLQQLMRELGTGFEHPILHRQNDRQALLVPVPGEQHTFGLGMVAEFFRRAGWTVWNEPLASTNDMVGIVRSEWFAVIGFSVSSASRLDALATCIRRVRRASRNPAVGIMVGGAAFIDHPELAALVGADTSAIDGRQAALQAEALLALRATSD
jgi:MerR family transcriptional regulator, light-induced transcriptional regulator